MTNGIKYKIQRRGLEGFLFKKEVWKDLGRPYRRTTVFQTTYYDTLHEATIDFDKFTEHDDKLKDWEEVKI